MFHATTANEVLYGGAAGGGKELWVGTPIPTPEGFVPIGDLKVGDQVYGPDGKPHTVLKTTSPKVHEAHRFVFDDGSEIICNAEHLWFTYTASDLAKMTRRTDEYRAKRRASRASRTAGNRTAEQSAAIVKRNQDHPTACKTDALGAVRTAQEIVDTLRTPSGRANHAIPVTAPLEIPAKDLPLDPYLLGLWLGDGTSADGSFTSADGLEQAFAEGGFGVAKQKRKYGYGIHGLSPVLRSMGLLKNKHVPDGYLWSSAEQRQALLQGLMDTDGNCNKNGSAEFTNENKELVEAAAFLIRSLGMKCQVTEGDATLNGRAVTKKYRIKFMPSIPVFRLERKLERQKTELRRTTRLRYLVSAEKIGPTPMRCIAIDSPDSLYLAGENLVPTHNSKAIIMDALSRCLTFPETHAYCFRRTYTELEDTLIKEAKASYPKELGRYNVGRHDFELKNGSVIHFRHCASIADMYNYAGAEIQWLYLDELTSFEMEIFTFLKTRLRAKKSLGVEPIVRCASNPGNIGHGWVKNYFVDAGPYGSLVQAKEYSKTLKRWRYFTKQYIPALATDNPYITDDYIFELERKPEALRNALLYGHWDAFEGQVFTEWKDDPAHYLDRHWTHVIEPRDIPLHWRRYMTFDHGYSRPWAALWWAMDEAGILYCYREAYGWNGTPNRGEMITPAEIAKKILTCEEVEAQENLHIDRIADPAIFDRSRGPSVADQMREADNMHGVIFRKGDNNRLNGLMQVHERLRFDDRGIPKMYFFKTCTNVLRTVPALPYSLTKPEDVDTDAEDHAYDCVRYMCQAYPMATEPIKRYHTRRPTPYDEPGEEDDIYRGYDY